MEFYDIIKTAIGASIPLVIFYFGYLIKRRQDKIEGKHRSRIQFELEVRSFGPQNGHYITEVTILLQNQGLVRNELNELPLSIRGIEKDKDIGVLKLEYQAPENIKKKSIADFPIMLVKTNILERKSDKNDIVQKEERWFVEPGVTQKFTYVALIPDEIRFILVRSSFRYHKNSKHTAQKVFEVSPHLESNKN